MESEHRPDDMSATRNDQAGQTQVEDVPVVWPNITDYWPDAPHRIGPAADLQEDPGAQPTRSGPPPLVQPGPVGPARLGPPALVRPRRRRVAKSLLGVALTTLLFGSGAVAYHRLTARPVAARPGPTTSVSAPAAASAPTVGLPAPAVVMPSPSPTPSASGSASASVRPSAAPPNTPLPAAATFELVSDLDELTVTAERLDQGVAQVSTPSGSNAVPRASMQGSVVQLAVDTKGTDGKPKVDVRLDNRISWAIRIRGGVRHLDIDLRGGTVQRFDLNGGATVIELSLPRLSGTLPIRMTGGVNTWKIRTDGQAAVGLLVRKGAGKVVLYARNDGGISRGKFVTSAGHGRGAIAIDAVGGIGQLSVADA